MLLAACAQSAKTHVDAEELMLSIRNDRAPTVLDVRTRTEYARGHVPGARHVPFYSTRSRYRDLGLEADDPVVVYCEHGPRAGIAKLGLWMAGHRQILYLSGHMQGWKAAGLPLERTDTDAGADQDTQP